MKTHSGKKPYRCNNCISISKMESLLDKRPFMVRPYGCGLCNELFDMDQEFLEHCKNHVNSPPDELFINLC